MYRVPYSDLSLIFSTYGEDRSRDPRAVESLLQHAVRDALNPFRPQTPLPNVKMFWIDVRGNVKLQVIPQRGRRGQSNALTYGLWISALTGIKAYVEHYPWLFFRFEICLDKDDGEGRILDWDIVGDGGLRRAFANTVAEFS